MDNRRQTQVCRRLSFAWLFGAQFEKQLDVVLAKARTHNRRPKFDEERRYNQPTHGRYPR